MDQVQLRNNYYMMTQKRLRREKDFRNRDKQAGGTCLVGWKEMGDI